MPILNLLGLDVHSSGAVPNLESIERLVGPFAKDSPTLFNQLFVRAGLQELDRCNAAVASEIAAHARLDHVA